MCVSIHYLTLIASVHFYLKATHYTAEGFVHISVGLCAAAAPCLASVIPQCHTGAAEVCRSTWVRVVQPLRKSICLMLICNAVLLEQIQTHWYALKTDTRIFH